MALESFHLTASCGVSSLSPDFVKNHSTYAKTSIRISPEHLAEYLGSTGARTVSDIAASCTPHASPAGDCSINTKAVTICCILQRVNIAQEPCRRPYPVAATVANTPDGTGGTDDRTSASVRLAEIGSELDDMVYNDLEQRHQEYRLI